MNEDNAQLLAQLQDIHATASPGWWPPAPGWWVLAAVILLALVFLLRIIAKKWALARRKKNWLIALDRVGNELDPAEKPQEYLAAVNRLFRAVALKAFPGTACARLQGKEWVDFIVALMPEQAADGLEVLALGPYEPLPAFDATAIDSNLRAWMKLYG